jgi:hypothetical protein
MRLARRQDRIAPPQCRFPVQAEPCKRISEFIRVDLRDHFPGLPIFRPCRVCCGGELKLPVSF